MLYIDSFSTVKMLLICSFFLLACKEEEYLKGHYFFFDFDCGKNPRCINDNGEVTGRKSFISDKGCAHWRDYFLDNYPDVDLTYCTEVINLTNN